MILVVGYKGNMGRRYTSILNYLQVPWFGLDVDDIKTGYQGKLDKKFTAVIIATPTLIHCEYIRMFAKIEVPILCEKPITKDLEELNKTLDYVAAYPSAKLDMVMQYKELVYSTAKKPTKYNYYKSGNDGIYWDCIQIIGLAKGEIYLSNESPIWKCQINGQHLKIQDMDWAYVEMIKRWLAKPGQSLNEIFEIHDKTAEFAYNMERMS